MTKGSCPATPVKMPHIALITTTSRTTIATEIIAWKNSSFIQTTHSGLENIFDDMYIRPKNRKRSDSPMVTRFIQPPVCHSLLMQHGWGGFVHAVAKETLAIAIEMSKALANVFILIQTPIIPTWPTRINPGRPQEHLQANVLKIGLSPLSLGSMRLSQRSSSSCCQSPVSGRRHPSLVARIPDSSLDCRADRLLSD